MAILLAGAGWYSRAALMAASDAFTLMAWVRPTTIAANYSNVLAITSSTALGILNSGGTTWLIGHPVADDRGTSTPVINVWYHVAITRAGTSYGLFVNGFQEVASTNAEGSATGFTIGDFDNTDNGSEWQGRVAAVKVWAGAGPEHALSKQQIRDEMRSYMPARRLGIAAVYPFEPKGLSAALIDYSGFGRNLTLGGSGHAVAEGPALTWEPRRHLSVFDVPAVAAGGGFKAAWAAGANSVLRAGR
jgi:hypothetical protein